ncbi:MAG: RNA polymerase-binding protein DksA [Gammaproteobacteria bacterium]
MAATRAKTSGKKKPTRKKTPAAKTTTRKKTVGKKAVSRKKTVSKKTVAKKAVRKKTVGKKAPTRKATLKKIPARKKTPARKPATKKTARKSTKHQPSLVEQIAPYKVKRGETYMNEDQQAHFHDLLMAWKNDLMEEADRTVHHMQDEASNFPDPNDRASQESEFSLELRTRDRERKLLRKIDKTLKRVETDDYGWCDACGAEIGIRRLEARPTATLCFDCKTLDEIRERQKGG